MLMFNFSMVYMYSMLFQGFYNIYSFIPSDKLLELKEKKFFHGNSRNLESFFVCRKSFAIGYHIQL